MDDTPSSDPHGHDAEPAQQPDPEEAARRRIGDAVAEQKRHIEQAKQDASEALWKVVAAELDKGNISMNDAAKASGYSRYTVSLRTKPYRQHQDLREPSHYNPRRRKE